MKKIFCLFIVVLFASCTKEKKFTELNDKNVVLILVDTLRADHLSTYGYSKETDPYLKSIANKSVLFENHTASCSSTAPATASIHTGLYPTQHGVISNINVHNNKHVKLNKLPHDITTLAEAFKQAGYKTYGISQNVNVSAFFGFDRGFDKFQNLTYDNAGAKKVHQLLDSWENEIKTNGKYFLYLHYMDPHEPYFKREPWYQKSDDKRQRDINAYDSEINYFDSELNNIISKFNILEDAVLIITADHGEELYQHGRKNHGKTLYTEVVQVPLMVHFNDIQPKRVKERTSHVDLFPTVADLFGLQSKQHWSGISLTPVFAGAVLPKRNIYSELPKLQNSHLNSKRSVYDENYHLIETDEKNGTKSYQLFDILKDYYEMHDIANPKIANDLKEKLKDIGKNKINDKDQAVSFKASDETLDQLKTLGYVN